MIYVSPYFLAAMTKVLFLDGRPGTRLCLQPTLTFCEAIRIQSLLYNKSSPALLVRNQTYTKMLHCFIICFLGLSEKKYIAFRL